MFSPENLMGYADSIANYLLNTKEGQEKMNTFGKWAFNNLGTMLGPTVRNQMPKTKDIMPMLLMAAMQRFAPQLFGQNQPQNQQQQSNPQTEPQKSFVQ